MEKTMRNNLLKYFLALVLAASFLVGVAACANNVAPEATDKIEPAENTENNDDETALKNTGKTSLGTISGSGLAFYLKLDGIDGDSKDADHERWIDVIDFSLGMETEYSTDELMPSLQGKYSVITFTHKVDKATPMLQKLCMNGACVNAGALEAVKSEAGAKKTVFSFGFNMLTIVNTTVKSVTDESGKTYLLEEVSMTAQKETLTAEKSAQNLAGVSGMSYYVKLDGITGEYATPQGYLVDETEAEKFDKQFPEKVRLRLPTQIF